MSQSKKLERKPPKAAPAEEDRNRFRIVAEIQLNPGLTAGELQKRLGIAGSTLSYHTHRLQKQRVIWSRTAGARRLFYPATTRREDEKVAAQALLRHKTARLVYETILANPGSSLQEVTDLTGLSNRVVYYQVHRLVKCGLVTNEARSDEFRTKYASLVARSVEGGRPSAIDSQRRLRLPRQVRAALDIRPGDSVLIEPTADGARIRRAPASGGRR